MGVICRGRRKIKKWAKVFTISWEVAFLNVIFGVWLAAFYIPIFWTLAHGGVVFESNIIVARVEFCFSIVFTCWFLWQIPYIVIKLWRAAETDADIESAQSSGRDKIKRGG